MPLPLIHNTVHNAHKHTATQPQHLQEEEERTEQRNVKLAHHNCGKQRANFQPHHA